MEAALDHAVPEPGPTAPRALGSGAPLTRAELLDAPVHWPVPAVLDAALTHLKGVGPKLAEAGAELGIESLGDLLRHIPHTYRDAADPMGIGDLRLGEEATVEVKVLSAAKQRPTRRRGLRILEAHVGDESGSATATWFNRGWLAERLQPGTRLLLRGKLSGYGFNVTEHEILGSAEGESAGIHTTGMVPVHPASEKLRPQRLREWAWQAVSVARNAIEPIPAAVRGGLGMPSAPDALAASHFPAGESEALAARRRLAFEELLLYQASLATRRARRREGRVARPLDPPGSLVSDWLGSLPFELTGDQLAAIDEVDADLGAEAQMQRLLMGEVGSGKAQPLTANVLTPAGFQPMGTLRVGDKVVNPDGSVAPVTGVFPQGERDVWRVHFSDGTSAESDLEHLWQVQTSTARSRGERPKVMTLREIQGDLRRPSGAAKWHVELPEPVDLECGIERPLDPYLLGLLLGDGGMSVPNRVVFTSADSELVQAVRDALPEGWRMRQEAHRPYDWTIVGEQREGVGEALTRVCLDEPQTISNAYAAGATCAQIADRTPVSHATIRLRLREAGVTLRQQWDRNPLLVALRDLGLTETRSQSKSVPRAYKEAPIADRHALLQGLLDTDGTIASSGFNVSFSSTSEHLAEDVAWLVRSLGGRARCRKMNRKSGISWRTSVILPARFPPFRLTRKAERLRPRTKYANPAKAIVELEWIGTAAMQCIAVGHPNQLYVTDGFSVTHNTVVATYAMLRASECGGQAALMAPTETLAEQHFRTLEALLGSEGPVPFALLTGATPAPERRTHLRRLASGQPCLTVGTHALIQPDVEFASLTVAVIDEQHRFGVAQRAALDAKGPEDLAPHALHMTATPIPRTLSLTAYGDLDTTAIRELPKGRQPIKTWVVDELKRAGAYGFIRDRLREGRQAYVVCPLVSESVAMEAKAAEAEAELLARGELSDFRVAVLHGQMPSEDKSETMRRFAAGEIDVLVATSVIEVGVDVPNATVMLVESAERYGLSQLHQLRGRVGRGEHESSCILFPGVPAKDLSEAAELRLGAIASDRDGFELAEVDLGIRGEGELLGTRQHGLPRFRAALLPDDAGLLLEARDTVRGLLERYGSLEDPALGPLMLEARRRFGDERVERISA